MSRRADTLSPFPPGVTTALTSMRPTLALRLISAFGSARKASGCLPFFVELVPGDPIAGKGRGGSKTTVKFQFAVVMRLALLLIDTPRDLALLLSRKEMACQGASGSVFRSRATGFA